MLTGALAHVYHSPMICRRFNILLQVFVKLGKFEIDSDFIDICAQQGTLEAINRFT